MKTEMTHRERILAAINHEPCDRVPVDYWGVPEITEKMMKHFGVKDMIGLSEALDIDKIMGVGAPLKPGRRTDMWGIEYKKVPLPNGAGYYDEPVCFPLGGFETIDEIEAGYEWPTTDMFDYSGIKAQCEMYRQKGYAIEGGYISLTYFYEIVRGTEQMLLDFAGDPELAEHVLFRLNEFASEHAKKILEAGDGLIDITQVTDDFGMQSGLIMSETMIKRYVEKYYVQNVAQAKKYGAAVFHHDDGAVAELIPWIVEMGCQILNPVQWHLPGWDLKREKEKYGAQLCFHGGIDNQEVLPFMGTDDVKKEVQTCIDALFSDNTGFILAPCHNLQAITPVENVIAMYECAKTYGVAR